MKEVLNLADHVQKTGFKHQESTSDDSSTSSVETEILTKTKENTKLKSEIAYMIQLLHREINEGKHIKMEFQFKEQMIMKMEKEMRKELQYQIDQVNLIKVAEQKKSMKNNKRMVSKKL